MLTTYESSTQVAQHLHGAAAPAREDAETEAAICDIRSSFIGATASLSRGSQEGRARHGGVIAAQAVPS